MLCRATMSSLRLSCRVRLIRLRRTELVEKRPHMRAQDARIPVRRDPVRVRSVTKSRNGHIEPFLGLCGAAELVRGLSGGALDRHNLRLNSH